MTDERAYEPGTWVIHADDASRGGSVAPPIHQATTFAADSDEEFLDAATRSFADDFYVRYGNPNHTQVADVVARLEGAQRAIVTAAGMGAVSTLALGLLRVGDHVIVQTTTYPGTSNLVENLLARFGVTSTAVDQTDPGAFERAMRASTRLVLVETPSNPLLDLTDIAAVSAIAHEGGALVAVDNTIATPINQRPLEHGADLVWHSATKYLGGHSDVSAGVIAGSEGVVEQIWRTHLVVGSVLNPFDAWLLLRGLRTLNLRMQRHNENGIALAEALATHPSVARVFYPGLESHAQHALAISQMDGSSGLLSFEVAGGAADADRVVSRLRLAKRAASLGSVHTIASRPAAMWSNASYDELTAARISPQLVRVSIGIEAATDLVADFLSALES
jgi:methionine-gamma-lyase